MAEQKRAIQNFSLLMKCQNKIYLKEIHIKVNKFINLCTFTFLPAHRPTVLVCNWTYFGFTLEHASGTSMEQPVQVYGVHNAGADATIDV